MNTSDPRFRDTVAEAVHQAVCKYTGGDGLGNCDLYALAGTALLTNLTRFPYQLQMGSLQYLADPDGNGWFEIDARHGGMERFEYHAWIALAGTVISRGKNSDPNICEVGQIIDLSVRHFKVMVEKMPQIKSATRIGDNFMLVVDPGADKIQWTRPDGPPPYLWSNGQPPDEYRYSPDLECMKSYHAFLKETPMLVIDLSFLVISQYHKLTRGG